MSIALLFSGQGSQKPGMLHTWSDIPEVAETVEEASALLKEDSLNLDTTEALHGTRAVQLSLLILQTGVSRALLKRGLNVDYLAGHSLGAWSAAVIAGVLSFSEAVDLVDVRARGMADAAPSGYGMCACTGLSEGTVDRLTGRLQKEGREVWVANRNSTDQCSVSGANKDLDEFSAHAKAQGARKIIRLAVSVPGHSPKMTSAKNALHEESGSVYPRRPKIPVMSNVSGRLLRTGPAILKDLVDSTNQTVRWSTGIASIAERRVDHWIQVSPGDNLIGLLRDLDISGRAWCVDNVGIDETLAYSRRCL